MSLREKENAVRLKWLAAVEKWLIEQNEDPMRVGAVKSASKANYGLMMPTLTEDGDEIVLRFEISCCRKEVDPYSLAEEYKKIVAEEEARKKPNTLTSDEK